MPIAPVMSGTILAPNLVSTGMVGGGMPSLAQGVINGLIAWTPQISVTTVDGGSAGVGSGQIPCIIVPTLLYGFLLESFASMGILGPMAPLFCLGLSNGIAAVYALTLVKTLHPSVGTGAAVARFVPVPAPPSMIAGFASAGMVGQGPTLTATAIGLALTKTFSTLILPVPIIGSASPVASTGIGSGKIL